MTEPLVLHGLVGVEHVQPDGSFVAHHPDLLPPKLRAGDRLWARVQCAPDAWVYAIAVADRRQFRRIGTWGPELDGHSARTLWPTGRALAGDEARMYALIVIASRGELAWARDLEVTDCAHLVGKRPADPPVTPCDHLHGLFRKVQPRPRGLVAPQVGFFVRGTGVMPGIAADNRGEPYTALEWPFTPALAG